jgi:membrane-associated phospholipid phosphatase
MVQEVYRQSKVLTPEEKRVAHYWKDVNPGVTATGHWLNILRLVIAKDQVSLEKAALAYALTGIALNDTWISSWKTRYKYNIQRPITYIREVLGDTAWMPEITTPPHPEYPGGHAALSSSVAEVLTAMFGEHYALTDRTYEFLGMGARNYPSFRAIAEEAAISKVYGGIHYRLSVQVGLQQGMDVSRNVLEILTRKEGGHQAKQVGTTTSN